MTDRPRCTRPNCSRPVLARGLCSVHYQRDWRRRHAQPRPPKPTTCAVEGCDEKPISRGLCHRCYEQEWSANGHATLMRWLGVLPD